jgi:hypothetical protein
MGIIINGAFQDADEAAATVAALGTTTAAIGDTADEESDSTIFGGIYAIKRHIHAESKVYPTLAPGVVVTGGAGAWQLGNFAEIVPVNTITTPFDIHFLNISNASVADTFELVLYAAAVEIGRIRVTRSLGAQLVNPVTFMTPLIAANTQIQAKVASSSGGGDTLTIAIVYHTY